MWFQRGLSYGLVLILTCIFPAGYCQLRAISFMTPNIESILTKGVAFDVVWLMHNRESLVRLQLNLYRRVGSDYTKVSILQDDSYSTDGYNEDQYPNITLGYTWTPSLSLESDNDYRVTLTDIDTLLTITSEPFTLQGPSSNSISDEIQTHPATSSEALSSTFPTSSPSITASLTSSPTTTASTSPESSSTPSSSNSSLAVAIGGSVSGVFAVIVIAFIIIARRKGWFIGKAQDPELVEMDGGMQTRVRHLPELEGDDGRLELEGDHVKYLASAQAELPASVPVFELPEEGHDEIAEG